MTSWLLWLNRSQRHTLIIEKYIQMDLSKMREQKHVSHPWIWSSILLSHWDLSILSAELHAICLALYAPINYKIESEYILCVTDSKSALLLLQNNSRMANDKDLCNIRRKLLNLKTKASHIYFQHIQSHKGISHNDKADSLAVMASMLIPNPFSDLNSHDIIRQRSNVNHIKLFLSLFHRLNTCYLIGSYIILLYVVSSSQQMKQFSMFYLISRLWMRSLFP